MMKNMLPFLTGLIICASVSLAAYKDGFITSGEYEYGVRWYTNDPPLIIDGGGADVIEMWDYSCLEVRSTSTPINNDFDTGGIWDIFLDDHSELLYLNGATEEITIEENAKAILRGGRIDAITSMQYATLKHIDFYCRPGWSWLLNDQDKIGITGLWENSTPFSIEFIDDADYDPAWMNINVIEVPEPTALTLQALGGFLIRRKK